MTPRNPSGPDTPTAPCSARHCCGHKKKKKRKYPNSSKTSAKSGLPGEEDRRAEIQASWGTGSAREILLWNRASTGPETSLASEELRDIQGPSWQRQGHGVGLSAGGAAQGLRMKRAELRLARASMGRAALEDRGQQAGEVGGGRGMSRLRQG